MFEPAQVVQGSQLDVEVAAVGCPLLCFDKQRAGLVLVVKLFNHSEGDQHVGLITAAGHRSSHAQGLLTPATSLLALAGIDQRLGQGGGDPCPQRRRRIPRHQFCRLRAEPQHLLFMAPTKMVGQAFACPGPTQRISAHIDLGDDLSSKGDRPLDRPGASRRIRGPQDQLDPVAANDNGWLGHLLPQRQRLLKMPQGLCRGQDGLGLGRRLHRGDQCPSQVMTGQAVVGEFSGRHHRADGNAVTAAGLGSLG
jgi:hypothetical protein